MFRFLALFAFLVGTPLMAATPPSAETPTPLRVAIDRAYSPYSLIGPTGEATGLAVELWRVWSEATGTPIEFIPSGWEGTLEALRSGKADVHFGLFKNASRAEWADFAEPIHRINTALFFRVGNDKPVPLDKLAGEKVGVWAGTYQHQFLKDNHPDIELVALENDDQLIIKLLKGKIRAILNEVPSVEADLAAFGIRGVLTRSDESLFSNYVRPAVRKGERDLLEHINEGFRKIPSVRLNDLEKMWMSNPSDHFFAGAGGEIEFSPEEEAWLAANPVVKLAVTTFIQPVDILDEAGNYKGLNADLIDMLNKKLGINIAPEFFDSWGKVVKAATEGAVDGAFSLSITPEREKSVLFTKPYAFDPIIAIVARSRDDIVDWKDLEGRTVSVVRGASIIEEVQGMIGGGVLSTVESEFDGLKAVEFGAVDAHISWLIPYGNAQRAKPVDGLKIALTRNSEGGTLRIGIHKDRPELLGILRKGLNAISREELTTIRNKWLFPKEADQAGPVELSADELGWMKAHPIIRLAVLKDYAPFDLTDDEGQHAGLHTELLKLMNMHLGANIVAIPFDTWKEAYDKAAAGELEGIMSLSWTKEREKTFLFSTPYHYDPADLVVRAADGSVKTWPELNGKAIWTRAGSSLISKIKEDLPAATILEAENEEDALKQLASGNGDAYVAWISTEKSKLKAMGLKVAAAVDTRQGELLIGVHHSKPLVAGIVQKGLNIISTRDMAELRDKWLFGEDELIELTAKEQAWINAHPEITLAATSDWPPFEFKSTSGIYKGITAAVARLAAKRAGLVLKPVFEPWEKELDMLRRGELDLAPGLYRTKDREEFLLFTRPFIEFYDTIYSQANRDDIRSMADLTGKKVAAERGYAISENIKADYPDVTLVPVTNAKEALQLVSTGRADAYVGNQVVAEHLINVHLMQNVVSVGFFSSEPQFLAMGVPKDRPLLRDILDRALAQMTEAERRAIMVEYLGTEEMIRSGIQLTQEERAWLKEHKTVRMGDDFLWPPFSFMDEDNKFSGVAAGYSEILSERAGIEFEPMTGLSWAQVMEKIKGGDVDILPAVARTKEREAFLNFTKPYISLPIVVATRKDGVFVDSLGDLTGLRVGIVDGYVTQEIVARDQPKIVLVPYPNIGEGLKALDENKIAAFVDNLGSITYEIDRLGFEEIKIAAPTKHRFELSFGVRKDWPQLAHILDKALETIDEKERAAIKNTWMAIEVKFGLDMKTVLQWAVPIGFGTSAIFLMILVWNRRLGREVKERKRAQAKETEALEAVLASEERFRGFAEVASDWYWEMDADLRYTYVSPAYERIVGRPPDALIGRTRREMYKGNIPGERDAWMAFLDTLDHHQDFEEFTYTYNRPSGERLVLSNNGRAMFGKSGEFRGYRGSGNDITERKEAERELSNAFGVITESIDYAAHIQQSLLPPDTFLAQDTIDHFIIWEPRDVVGGDIYWYRRCEGGFLVILADCTGHGVPGAFMTIIATGALDRALRDQPDGDPAAVLKIMNRSVKHSLSQDREEGASDDGLELGICRVVPDARKLVFAGPRFSLFHSDGNDLAEMKGDKSAIGYRHVSIDQEYSNREMAITEGQRFYMVSDGLIDQIGGERHRMFGKKRFKKLVVSGWDKPFAEQKRHILDALAEYQGGESRRDDLSVVGFTMG